MRAVSFAFICERWLDQVRDSGVCEGMEGGERRGRPMRSPPPVPKCRSCPFEELGWTARRGQAEVYRHAASGGNVSYEKLRGAGVTTAFALAVLTRPRGLWVCPSRDLAVEYAGSCWRSRTRVWTCG